MGSPTLTLRPGYPTFSDLPWGLPLAKWSDVCNRLEQVPIGVTRHTVVFVNYDGNLFALKELPPSIAEAEYRVLLALEEQHLPAVTPVGFALANPDGTPTSVLITRFLDRSIPYRSLFMGQGLVRYREHLLDAIAGLIVQLHLLGVFWGDCSLSNTLYRRDAGTLQAYLVDAETAELHPSPLPPTLRHHDLEIMDENVSSDLSELAAMRFLTENIPIDDVAAYIRLRYRRLWAEITQEVIINPDERYRIQERIRALNDLGFSVGEVILNDTPGGSQLKLRAAVTARSFHRDQLLSLIAVEAEEQQARKIMNEIQEIKATLSQVNNRSVSLSAAAYHWLKNIYQPTLERLAELVHGDMSAAELYCQVLEHKWYLSEQAQHDVGHIAAADDYLHKFRIG
jgi:hypothetical protein